MKQELQEAALWFFGIAGWAVVLLVLAAMMLGLMFFVLIVAPEASRRCGQTLARRNIASFVMGLPITGLALLGVAVLSHISEPIGALAFAGVGLILAFGATVAGEDLGRRLFYACGREGNRATRLLVGWPLLFVASLVPIVGWFLIFPYVVGSGVGSIALTALSRNSA